VPATCRSTGWAVDPQQQGGFLADEDARRGVRDLDDPAGILDAFDLELGLKAIERDRRRSADSVSPSALK